MSRRLPAWLLATTMLVYVFLHLPILVLTVFSFNDSKFSVSWTGFTLRWYRRLFERPDILQGLKASFLVAILATIISAVFGTMLALALSRHHFRARRTLEGFLYLPVVTPEIVVGISLLVLFALLGFPLGLTTIIIAHVAFCLSFVVIVLLARLRGMDRHLEEAAMVLGADEMTTFWRVTLPQLRPGIFAGALLAFTMSFDDFVITSFVSGSGSSTLPIVVYGMVRRTIEPSINAISTLILLVTAVLIYSADRLMRESRDTSEPSRALGR
jgi:spermidine/putrescine transport system permease protein